MALPKSFHVGALLYTVDIVEDMNDWHGALGSIWANKLKAKIDGSMPESKQEEVFFHELQHIAANTVGIGNEVTLTQEEWNTRTAATLYSILKQNGWLSFGPVRVRVDKIEYNIPPRSPESS